MFDETAGQLEARIKACDDQINALDWLISNMRGRAITLLESRYILIAMTMHAAAKQSRQRLEEKLTHHRVRNKERGIKC